MNAPIGYWTIAAKDIDLTLEQFEDIRAHAAELTEAIEEGRHIVVVEGITLTWHAADCQHQPEPALLSVS